MGINIGGAIGVISGLGGLFGGNKDPGRMKTADDLYTRALAGDVAAEVQLRCLSGIKNDPRTVTYGFVTNPADCGWATETARAYGRTKLAQLEAARRLAPGGTVAPAPHPDSPAGQAAGLGSLPTEAWWFPLAILAGGALVLYQGSRQTAGRR